jgi:hypothetical protein
MNIFLFLIDFLQHFQVQIQYAASVLSWSVIGLRLKGNILEHSNRKISETTISVSPRSEFSPFKN